MFKKPLFISGEKNNFQRMTDYLRCFNTELKPVYLHENTVSRELLLLQAIAHDIDIVFVHESSRVSNLNKIDCLEYKKDGRKHQLPIRYIKSADYRTYLRIAQNFNHLTKKKKLLFFEKNNKYSFFVSRENLQKDIHILSCSNKKCGLNCLAKTYPDMIIIDVEATDLDAFSLCHKLRQSKNLAQTPVILISSFSEITVIENILEKGITDYIFKPSDHIELLQKIKFHLNLEKSHKERILLVDDCRVTLSYLHSFLEKNGYEVEIAQQATDGLAKVFSRPPDLIITDYLMPEMDGWSFCYQLNQHIETKNIPIIMISAKKSEIDFRKTRILKVEDYITKPIDHNRLLNSIRYAILNNKRDKQTRRLQEIDQEFIMSRAIQKNFMPPSEYDIENTLKIRAAWSPARQLGGDFYWFNHNRKKEDDILLAIADVSGKGLSSSLIASAAQSCLRAISKFTLSPPKLLSHLNTFLFESPNADCFVTCFIARVNIKKKYIQYSSAGHQRMLFYQQSSRRFLELSSDNIPCGLEENEQFGMKTITYGKGDHLMLYTDGLTEARNPQNQFYSFERLRNKMLHLMNSQATKKTEFIFHDVITFSRELPQADDITVMIAEFF